ncbi:MAG TPA: DUF2090 domain-containing protein [bacterium]|jgi:myo-inositol catabolism protein IolC|nr:DUF2090 domain-containing protein [bacterium]HOG38325.1 DUF2090 domain-containing protein [bacterium]HQI03288.1 DUF2090 domain-containing protein [bacterium]
MFKKKYLFILPFDHRSFFIKNFKFGKDINRNEKSAIVDFKEIIYQGFLCAYKNSKYKQFMGILIDEEYGSSIIKDAKKKNIILSVSAEKSGQDFFDFEYGKNFRTHIKNNKANFVKILVRYDYRKDNKNQLKKIKTLYDFCKKNKFDLLLELLTPNFSNKFYFTQKAVEEILSYKIFPCIWKIEGYEKKSDWDKVIKSIKIYQKNPKIIMLGRGESLLLIKKWIKSAKGFKEIIGFAVGRTIFLEAISDFYKNKITRDEAIKKIASRYLNIINLWVKL